MIDAVRSKLEDDLNRVQQQPITLAIEDRGTQGLDDEVLAAATWDSYRRRSDSCITDHFQGLYRSTMQCQQCGASRPTFEPFTVLTLALPPQQQQQLGQDTQQARDQQEGLLRDPQRKAVSLQDCLADHTQAEQLSADNKWLCPRCKAKMLATQKLDLWYLPEVLVVHLKRFSYTASTGSAEKLDQEVTFPLLGLDLSRYALGNRHRVLLEQEPLYDCYAVCNHTGSVEHGHYTAFVQMPAQMPVDDHQWYVFDDSRVEGVKPEEVQSPAAYLLFYRRRAQAEREPRDLARLLLLAGQQHWASRRQQQQQQQQHWQSSSSSSSSSSINSSSNRWAGEAAAASVAAGVSVGGISS